MDYEAEAGGYILLLILTAPIFLYPFWLFVRIMSDAAKGRDSYYRIWCSCGAWREGCRIGEWYLCDNCGREFRYVWIGGGEMNREIKGKENV